MLAYCTFLGAGVFPVLVLDVCTLHLVYSGMAPAAKARGRKAIAAPKSRPIKKNAPSKTQAKTIRAKTAPPPRATIRVPVNLRTALGDDPAATIAALLELHAALEGRAPQRLRDNPFLDVAIDAAAKYLPFSASTIVGLRNWRGTQRELVDEAVRVSGRSLAQLAHAGLLREAAAEVQNEYRRQHVDVTAPGHGIEGVRDQDLSDALARLKAQGRPVSASTLRGQTGVSFRTCANFLTRKAQTLGLHLQPDRKTYSWTPVSTASAPIAAAGNDNGGEA